jgi:DNA-binding transcriptional LysR family regulator
MRESSAAVPLRGIHHGGMPYCGIRNNAAMNIDSLRTFAEVVRLGSFAAAARALDASPSSITRTIAALEADLGARLLQRTTRKLALTEGGEAYLAQVAPLLQELAAAGDALRSGAGQIRGVVRVTASVAFGQAMLVPLLPALHATHPGLQIELLLTDAVVDLVVQRVDIALRLGPSTDSSLVGQQLCPVRYRVVASPGFLRKAGKPRRPEDLAACECLRFPLPGYRTQWSFRPRTPSKDAVTLAVPVGGWLVVSSALALRQAALDGLGPALLADWLVMDEVKAGRLVDLFPKWEATGSQFDSAVWLLYASREHVPQRVRAVIDFLRARLSDLAGGH